MSTPARQALRQTVEQVKADREHGSSWLAQQAVRALAEASASDDGEPPAQVLDQLRAAARAFAASRPSMAALANAAARVWAAGARAGDDATRLRALHTEAERLLDAQDTAVEALLPHARGLLAGAVVYTHSRSGTVEALLTRLAREGAIQRVYVSESHPGDEGIATARALAGAGAQVTLVADAACGLFVKEAAAVVIGADSVRANGDVVNKVGSYPLALAARAAGVPVYALCETLKIAARDVPLTLEEMAPDELLPQPISGVSVRNVYFDVTPAALVTGVVTERGVLSGEAITTLAQEAGRALEQLMS